MEIKSTIGQNKVPCFHASKFLSMEHSREHIHFYFFRPKRPINLLACSSRERRGGRLPTGVKFTIPFERKAQIHQHTAFEIKGYFYVYQQNFIQHNKCLQQEVTPNFVLIRTIKHQRKSVGEIGLSLCPVGMACLELIDEKVFKAFTRSTSEERERIGEEPTG